MHPADPGQVLAVAGSVPWGLASVSCNYLRCLISARLLRRIRRVVEARIRIRLGIHVSAGLLELLLIRGRATVNLLPLPGSLETLTEPP